MTTSVRAGAYGTRRKAGAPVPRRIQCIRAQHAVLAERGSRSMSIDKLKACLREHQNDFHPSYSTLSFARISRL